jgi:hypothetical protein
MPKLYAEVGHMYKTAYFVIMSKGAAAAAPSSFVEFSLLSYRYPA